MPLFKEGEKVIIANTEQRGVIEEVKPPMAGRQIYVVFTDGTSQSFLESHLLPNLDITDPFARLQRGIFGNHLDSSRLRR